MIFPNFNERTTEERWARIIKQMWRGTREMATRGWLLLHLGLKGQQEIWINLSAIGNYGWGTAKRSYSQGEKSLLPEMWPQYQKGTGRKFSSLFIFPPSYRASQVVLVVNNPWANAGDIRDMGSIPASERFPEGGHGDPFQLKSLTWMKQLVMPSHLLQCLL